MMATPEEHRARAVDVLNETGPIYGDPDEVLERARPHLVGWLAEDLAEHSALYIGLSESDQMAVLREISPGRHLWYVAVAWRVTDDEVADEQVQLTNRKLLVVRRLRCAMCGELHHEAAGKPCRGRARPVVE